MVACKYATNDDIDISFSSDMFLHTCRRAASEQHRKKYVVRGRGTSRNKIYSRQRQKLVGISVRSGRSCIRSSRGRDAFNDEPSAQPLGCVMSHAGKPSDACCEITVTRFCHQFLPLIRRASGDSSHFRPLRLPVEDGHEGAASALPLPPPPVGPG